MSFENNSFYSKKMFLDKQKILEEIKRESIKFEELESFVSKENKILKEVLKQVSNIDSGQNLVNCDFVNNKDFLLGVTKKIFEIKKKPVIILTSINYKTLLNFFQEKKVLVKDVFIIDTVSKNIVDVNDFEKIFFVDSLRNLTQLQIKLFKIISKNSDSIIVFDSIDVLELYHSENIILKFVYSFTKMLRKNKINGYYIVNSNKFVQKIGQFCDNIIQINKVE